MPKRYLKNNSTNHKSERNSLVLGQWHYMTAKSCIPLYKIYGNSLIKVLKAVKKIPTFQPNHNLTSKSIKQGQNINKRKIYTETPEKVQGE